MGADTKIEWCDFTFNPWLGCTNVSPGCDHCYAEALMDKRYHKVQWGAGQPRVRTSEANWRMPIKWDKAAAAAGRRDRVFCASLADVFDNEVDPVWRADLFKLIADTPNLDWLLLTKRIGNAARMFPFGWQDFGPPANVWIGATIVNQEEYDRDIGKLLSTPAKKHFISMEPLLGAIDMRLGGASMPTYSPHRPLLPLDLVIVGGESGPKARDFDIGWCRSIVAQCKAAGVACFVKQMGDKPCWSDDDEDSEPPHWGRLDYGSKGKDIDRWPADLRVREVPHG